jgi:hypothetical protein
MVSNTQAAAVLACQALVVRIAHVIDDGDCAELAGLVTSSFRFSFAGREVNGAEAFAAFMSERAAGRTSRHLTAVVLPLEVAADRVETVANFAAYLSTRIPPGTTDVPASLVGCYRDTFTLTPDGWRMSARRVTLTFGAF